MILMMLNLKREREREQCSCFHFRTGGQCKQWAFSLAVKVKNHLIVKHNYICCLTQFPNHLGLGSALFIHSGLMILQYKSVHTVLFTRPSNGSTIVQFLFLYLQKNPLISHTALQGCDESWAVTDWGQSCSVARFKTNVIISSDTVTINNRKRFARCEVAVILAFVKQALRVFVGPNN